MNKAKKFLNKYWSNGDHNDFCANDVYNALEQFHKKEPIFALLKKSEQKEQNYSNKLIALFYNKKDALIELNSLNNSRTQTQINNGIKYYIEPYILN